MNILRQVHKKLLTILKKVCKHLKRTLALFIQILSTLEKEDSLQYIQIINKNFAFNM